MADFMGIRQLTAGGMANPGVANNESMYGHCQGNWKTISAYTESTD
jgi:hypothetical protein